MTLNYEIRFKRKNWIVIASAEVQADSFSEGDAVMTQLMAEQYNIAGTEENYAEFMGIPSLSLEGINML